MATKKVKVAVYLQDYYSADREEYLQKLLMEYIKLIKNESSWEYTGAYMDSDLSFPSHELNKLLRECKNGTVNVVLSPSISKFTESLNEAMQTVDSINAVGIRVIFKEEGIDSSTSQGKALLSKLRKTLDIEDKLESLNKKWVLDKKFEKGEPIFMRLLGYKLVDEVWVVVPEEAKIVKEAFKLHLEGQSLLQIARRFITKKYKKANGRLDWSARAVADILRNERYTGDALCRKTDYNENVDDSVSIKREQYLIKDHHEAIISHEDFEKANKLLKSGSKGEKRGKRKTYPLSQRIQCNMCSGNFQRFKNRDKVFWRCGNHIKSKSLCPMTSIKEEVIKKAVINAFFEQFETEIKDFSKLVDELRNVETFKDRKINPVSDKIEELIAKENKLILQGDNKTLQLIKDDRAELEELFQKRTELLKLLEEDYQYRVEAIKTMEDLVESDPSISGLKAAMEDWEFLRAWVVKIGAFTPYSFEIYWLNGETSTIELEAGE